MFIYLSLCTVSLLIQCSLLTAVDPSTDSIADTQSNPRNLELNDKPNLIAILNPLYLKNANEGDVSDESNEPGEVELPKLTIWEFPTERRVFIGDVEIFINSNEDDQKSLEAIDPENTLVLHPHKHHDLHRNIADEKQFPAFRQPKDKPNYNEEFNDKPVVFTNLRQNANDGLNDMIKRFSRLIRDKRNVEGSGLIDLENDIILDNTSPVSPKDRRRRMWDLYDYLKWLLSNADEDTKRDMNSATSNEENKSEQINDLGTENLKNIQQAIKDALPNNVDSIIEQNKIIETVNKLTEQRINLVPVHPDLIKILLDEYKDNHYRRKRRINSESELNMLVNDSDDDIVNDNDKSDNVTDSPVNTSDEDDNEDSLIDNFISYFLGGQIFYSVLKIVY